MADIGLGDFGPDGHRREFGDAQNQRGLLLCIEGLAFARIKGDHSPRHGRVDTRVTQLGFIATQAGLGLADLRLEHINSGLGGSHFSQC